MLIRIEHHRAFVTDQLAQHGCAALIPTLFRRANLEFECGEPLIQSFLCQLRDLFIVIAPPHADAAKALVTDYLNEIRTAAPADPEHPVLAPGDRAHAVRTQSIRRGMFIDDGLWADLLKLAAEAHLPSQKENAR